MALERTHTPQNLLQAVGEAGTGTFEPWASYQERIPGLVEGRTIGTVVGTMAYDAAMRPLASRYTKSGDRTVFGEQLSWTQRNQLAQRQRLDLNGWSEAFTYDRHDRLTGMERQSADGEFSLVSPSGRTAGWAFTYDEVHNLLKSEEQQLCSVERAEMPEDGSGRHRPESIGGKTLTWNDNGELIQKGDLYFTYDYRGRLAKIEQDVAGQLTELVNYTYDVLNRRVEQHFPNRTIRTVWDGWQPIEEYEVVDSGSDELMARRIYGRDIDEVVRLENRLSSDNAELQAFLPFYDSSGNLALMTSFLGGAVERYEYSPYGERHAWHDNDRPAIEQVRIADEDVIIEMSEAVDFEALDQAFAGGALTLQNLTQDEAVAFEIRPAVTKGRQAHRRIVLEVNDGSRPAVGDSVRLTLPDTGVVDYFGNSMDQTNIGNFAWPALDQVFTDTVPPKVASVCTTAEGRLEIQFSEPVNLVTANASIHVNNQEVTWTVAEAGYSLVSNVTLSAGSHELEISTDLLDLDDHPLADDFSSSFVLADGNLAQTVYTDEQVATGGSVLSNSLGFQGLHHDAVSGLVYVRNRYYDPELGRFITPDPMGFVDGPNVYQFAVGNPVNYRDPLGLESAEIHQRHSIARESGIDPYYMRPAAEGVMLAMANPYVNGPIMVVTGCGEAAVGASAAAASGGLAAAPGFFAMAHGADVCATGARTIWYGENQRTLTAQLASAGLVAVGMASDDADYWAEIVDVSLSGFGTMGSASRLAQRGLVLPAPRRYAIRPLQQAYRNEQYGEVFITPVEYLDDVQRQVHRVSIEEGRFVSNTGLLWDTRNASTIQGGSNRAIYAMDEIGNIYISNYHARGLFHHSSLLGGRPAAAAGEISIRNGVITHINIQSGHYRPATRHLRQFTDELSSRGANLSRAEVDFTR